MDRQRVQETGLPGEDKITDQLLSDIQVIVDEMKEQDMPNEQAPRIAADSASAEVLHATERNLEQVRADLKTAYSEQEYWRVRVIDLERVERTLDTVRAELLPKETASSAGMRDPSQFSNSKY